MKRIYGRDARVWAVGAANDRYWAELGLNNRTLIPYAVPNPPIGNPKRAGELRARLVSDADFVFLYVGRLSPEKGPLEIVAAFEKIVHSSDARPRLILVGDGPLRPVVEQRVAEVSGIVLAGARNHDQLGDFYLAADALVVPSRREAWGVVVNEAVANGLPIIASHRVASADDLLDSTSGWRYRAGDIEGLVSVMTAAMNRGRRRNPPHTEDNVAGLMAAELAALVSQTASAEPSGRALSDWND
ncbi:glycosyltransferase family 4 protein [Frankia sp. CiP3]|uniref:glycosyltransferase family 4 protein n=1 Tax=Frankia sp. CiP3 TaxID=2880971 RepID=UPI001EF5DC94|nr:glycosyltransferase family 4 protein [Frankia sp. CiP3]